jgi:hypothetical protein
MKKFLLLLFIAAPFIALSQAKIAIDTGSITLNHLHPKVTDTLKITAKIKNISSDTLKGYFRLIASVPISRKIRDTGALVTGNLNPGTVMTLIVEKILLKDTFRAGTNVIVVWPTGTVIGFGNIYGDSVQKLVPVAPNAIFVSGNGDQQLRIFPNPAGNEINFYSTSNLQISKISLLNVDGAIILTREAFQQNKLDISSFSPGIYLMNIAFRDGNVYTVRIIKN